MTRIANVLIVLLAIGVGTIILQIFLSKKEAKWPGLILPIIAVVISLIVVFSIAAYTTTGMTVTNENGVVVQEESTSIMEPIKDVPSLIFTVISVFLLYNIPTIILLAIYFACREKRRRKKALDKMQAQDLE
jgi:uncharacterized membrane-anchored protein YitT (DUF2179 family)